MTAPKEPQPLAAKRPAESNGHIWMVSERYSWEFCEHCGIVRRADDKNKLCKGKVGISLRELPPIQPTEDPFFGKGICRICLEPEKILNQGICGACSNNDDAMRLYFECGALESQLQSMAAQMAGMRSALQMISIFPVTETEPRMENGSRIGTVGAGVIGLAKDALAIAPTDAERRVRALEKVAEETKSFMNYHGSHECYGESPVGDCYACQLEEKVTEALDALAHPLEVKE